MLLIKDLRNLKKNLRRFENWQTKRQINCRETKFRKIDVIIKLLKTMKLKPKLKITAKNANLIPNLEKKMPKIKMIKKPPNPKVAKKMIAKKLKQPPLKTPPPKT